MSSECGCEGSVKLIFPCSGGSDVGALTDQAARRLTADGIGKIYCLAGIGGRLDAIMETTKSAAKILAIDGCKLDCARRTLRQAGFSRFEHIRLNDFGMEKGESPVNDENIEKVVLEGASALLK
ncbi:MAG TPA: putative zinc-binding protein [Armatimonadota bacterium]|nr:putative zinc-binding protein [Armatimonadota bacterium]